MHEELNPDKSVTAGVISVQSRQHGKHKLCGHCNVGRGVDEWMDKWMCGQMDG